MRYAEFRRQGLFVGSGVAEAGCKTVIGQRLKQSGMRWTVDGANAIIPLSPYAAVNSAIAGKNSGNFAPSAESGSLLTNKFDAHPCGTAIPQ
jgi:hypothetical protein